MKKYLPYFLFIALTIFVFRNLISHFSTALPDWYDYPYITWIINSNIGNLLELDWRGLVDTNAFYPHHNALFFSDLLLPQSFIGLLFRLFTSNPIQIFNSIFLITYLLNFSTSYIFWKHLFKSQIIGFVLCVATVFSPYYYMESSHFQMMSYWPFFLSLYYAHKSTNSTGIRFLVSAGMWAFVQFTASAYLGIFLLLCLGLFWISRIIVSGDFAINAKKGVITLTVFALLTAPVLIGYRLTQAQHGIVRPYEEYVIYSAHLSDYFFSDKIYSMLHKFQVIQAWNSFNKHLGGASGTGLSLGILAIISLGFWTKKKNTLNFHITWEAEVLFFLIIGIFGLVFSLGPRISFNGEYSGIPAPYHIVLKLVPIISSLRTTSRWAWLFYLAVIYFAGRSLSRMRTKWQIAIILLFILVEYLPISVIATEKKYWGDVEKSQQEICSSQTLPVLHVPVTHLDASGGLIEGLSYITTTELASLGTNCLIVNGYSGYDMPSIFALGNMMNQAISSRDEKLIAQLAQQSGAKLVVFHTKYLDVDPEFVNLLKSTHLLPSGRLNPDEIYYLVD